MISLAHKIVGKFKGSSGCKNSLWSIKPSSNLKDYYFSCKGHARWHLTSFSMLIPLPGISLPASPTVFNFWKPFFLFHEFGSDPLSQNIFYIYIYVIGPVILHPYYNCLCTCICVYASWVVNPHQVRCPTTLSSIPTLPSTALSSRGTWMTSSAPRFYRLHAMQCWHLVYLILLWVFLSSYTISNRDFPLKDKFSWATVEVNTLIKGRLDVKVNDEWMAFFFWYPLSIRN